MYVENKNREGLTIQKILQLFRLYLPKNTKTLARLKHFADLNVKKINEIKNLDIKGIILDVDDCIATNHGEILKENIEHLKLLKSQGIKIGIYSNMKATDRYDIIKDYVKIIINPFAKPDIRGFKHACQSLGLPPENLVMVGDNHITDGGSLKLKIPFVKIKPIKTVYKTLWKKIIMTAYSWLRSYYDCISRIHDIFREKPLTKKDLK
jgi:HAD superfamily phosphatase (TIGR01668 family)